MISWPGGQVVNEQELAETVAGGSSSWLGAYVNYARSLTDAPLMFHVGAGLVALATATGSAVSWQGGSRENWPNLYLLLLAPSGLYRKSTSVDLAMSLLTRAAPGRVMTNEYSPEQFLRTFAEHPASVMKEAEFSSLLERMKANYMSGFKQRLTELYDCVDEYSRHTRGEGMGDKGHLLRIERPALSILAASTTDWLVESITELDLRSGFIPRFLLWPATVKEPEPEGGYWRERDMARENALVAHLGALAHREKAVVSFRQVRDKLTAWNARMERTGDDRIEDLSGLYSRLGHHASKLCALLTISEDPIMPRYEVHPITAERVMALMEWVLVRSEETFSQHLVWERFERQVQKLLSWIPPEGADRSLLLKRSKLKSTEFEAMLKTLKERLEIDIDEDVPTGGRFKTVIRRLHPSSLEIGERRGNMGEGSGERSSPNGHAPLPSNPHQMGTANDWGKK